MSRVRIDRRMYLTEDQSRAVPDGDPEARHLLCPAGGELDRADAERYGLLDQPKPAPAPEEPAEPAEEKAAPAPANKARRAAANK
ncbi:hypothetical protein [Nonomuraea angiospora]|uniref:hypothetical protein n=1 Tax=Nonomuraea angiospora TaxID=46172 RepID=UPI0029A8F0E3|nr:hypothetical protein [Nonomuraea angiospora]MDX3101747.1 hypothetical protein [Nonomuraea angiospora]